MADKQAEIDKAEADLKQARADLEAERIAAAKIEAQTEVEARQVEKPDPAETTMPAQGGAPLYCAPASPGAHLLQEPAAPASLDMTAILDRILATMDRAGCDVCAARMVIKSELAKARKALAGRAAA